MVVDADRLALAPCTPRRARLLLSSGKAAVLRRYPFTIILKQSYPTASPRPVRLKIDPGSKTTGLAVVTETTGEVVWAAEIQHRGQLIKNALESILIPNRYTSFGTARIFSQKHREIMKTSLGFGVIRKLCEY